MPIDKTTQIPKPKDWDELEMLVWDLFRLEWPDQMAVRHGRKGQRQNGVDIYGHSKQGLVGIQVKGKTAGFGGQLTEPEMRAEVEKAAQFNPPIQRLIFATSAPRDAAVQHVARKLSDENVTSGLFPVDVLGWEDLQDRLTSYPDLLKTYYPQLFGDSVSDVEALRQPDIVVDTHHSGNRFGLMVHNIGEAAKFKANARFKGQNNSAGPFPLIWGLEAREENSVKLMKGEEFFLLLGSCEYLLNFKAHRIDIWEDKGQKQPFLHHPAFWYEGSRPDGPVQVTIQVLSDPPLVTPFERSYVIRFNQVDGGAVLE